MESITRKKSISSELIRAERINSTNLTYFYYRIFLLFMREAPSINDLRKIEGLGIINTLL